MEEAFKGSAVREDEVPKTLKELVEEKRNELISIIADVDDEIAECFLSEQPVLPETLLKAIRRATVARRFVPIFMGSAVKNKGSDRY